MKISIEPTVAVEHPEHLAPHTLLPRLGAAAVASVIFIIDTLTSIHIAIAVLYVAVILMSVNLFSRQGVMGVSLACIGLTLSAFLISHGAEFHSSAFARCLVSLSAIGITTLLALKNKAANDELQEQVRMLAQTHDAIIVRDMKGIITTWSPGAEALYGWTREQAIGQDFRTLLRPQMSLSWEQVTNSLIETGQWEGEVVEHRSDGTAVTVVSRCSLSRDESNQPKAILATHNDITEQKRAEEALHRSQTELAHVTRITTLGELAASIAHEVNQPLAAVTTNGTAGLRWLNREVPDIDEVRGAMERMLSETHRASEVIRRIRAMSRKTDPQSVPVDLVEVVQESLALVDREIKRNKIVLDHEYECETAEIIGDRVQLQQVIINLIMNGVQAMANAKAKHRTLHLSLRRADAGEVCVDIRDSGPGISPQSMPKLFNAFYTTKPEGMGMGLSICRSIIDAHGGRIWATSEEGQGAVFHVSFPANHKEPA